MSNSGQACCREVRSLCHCSPGLSVNIQPHTHLQGLDPLLWQLRQSYGCWNRSALWISSTRHRGHLTVPLSQLLILTCSCQIKAQTGCCWILLRSSRQLIFAKPRKKKASAPACWWHICSRWTKHPLLDLLFFFPQQFWRFTESLYYIWAQMCFHFSKLLMQRLPWFSSGIFIDSITVTRTLCFQAVCGSQISS